MTGDGTQQQAVRVHRLTQVVSGDEVTEFLSRSYQSGFNVEELRPGGKVSIHRTDVGPFSLDETSLDLRMHFAADLTADALMVGRVRSGRAEMTCGILRGPVCPGQAYIGGLPGAPTGGWTDGMSAQVVTVGMALVAATAGRTPHEPATALRMDCLTGATPAADRMWATAAEGAAAIPDALCTPLVADATARLLAATALSVFPNNFVPHDPLAPGPGHVGQTTLQCAAAFMEENAHRPVTLADIAAASSVSGRALQYAFRRAHGTGPLGYLRQVRLRRAHAELLAAHPADGTTVAAVAARWGWSNRGRFSTAYRKLFGTSPAETLRK
ncbi:helix-turn-helix transcriptional regulator [Streptomyces sp. NPDC047023]|uniref:helix-turn-helix transcriptional regulator n=1 Tax=Streptomyces sp. NPDC047023 TaxID=3155139 RepID=UPI0033EAC1AA